MCPVCVIHGETGLLIPPRDSAAMADAITPLVFEPVRRKVMGEAGRAYEKFGVRSMVEATAQVYRRAAASTHRSRR